MGANVRYEPGQVVRVRVRLDDHADETHVRAMVRSAFLAIGCEPQYVVRYHLDNGQPVDECVSESEMKGD